MAKFSNHFLDINNKIIKTLPFLILFFYIFFAFKFNQYEIIFMDERIIIDDIYKLKKNRIIIFITHRTSSLRNCDKIFVISNGKLVDEGAYHDVLSRNQNLNEINQYNDKN